MKVNVHVFDNIRVSNIFTLRNVYFFFNLFSFKRISVANKNEIFAFRCYYRDFIELCINLYRGTINILFKDDLYFSLLFL